MIPDGTSIGVLSAARWFQIYNGSNDHLAVDPYFCGLVKTYSSNAPVVDSAPAMSAYMTGMPQKVNNISIYPEQDTIQDIYPVSGDPERTYQPLATVLEGAKYELGKAVGIVATVEFPHATPGATAAHHTSRYEYQEIARQMAHNNIDVVFAGGVNYMQDDMQNHLQNQGAVVYKNDIDAFRKFNGNERVWALFCDTNLPYDLDRDTTQVPSLSEMTQKAIERLSKEDKGFFLMVEGSQVDYAAHANDAIGCITEFLAFDKAVRVALDFALKNGETTVIILPDHGNSGFVVGNYNFHDYARRGIQEVFEPLSNYQKTARGLEAILLKSKPEDFRNIFKHYTSIDLTDDELTLLLHSKNYTEGDYMQVSNNENLASSIARIMNSKTYIGFSSGGHTSEDVFLAAYHPKNEIPAGLNTNVEINNYLCDAIGLHSTLNELTQKLYSKHTQVFADWKYSISEKDGKTTLEAKKGRKRISIPANSSIVYINGKPLETGSLIVYMKQNNTFYLPENLIEKL